MSLLSAHQVKRHHPYIAIKFELQMCLLSAHQIERHYPCIVPIKFDVAKVIDLLNTLTQSLICVQDIDTHGINDHCTLLVLYTRMHSHQKEQTEQERRWMRIDILKFISHVLRMIKQDHTLNLLPLA